MRIAACATVLAPAEISLLHNAVLRILSEVGVCIEHAGILKKLAASRAQTDGAAMRVRFPADYVERFIAESDKFDWENVKPQVGSGAGIFEGRYLDPDTDELVPWTEERLAGYAKLAHYLDNVDHAAMLGCPVDGVDRRIIPLVQRYLCWKHGLLPGGSIWDTRLCPYIME
ncbi:MAG TPA: hypothetical protein ENN09_04545, partial [Planctomycetes bacterium]|nr:hypothetical protein [Planctomycetota bacterium]